MSKRHARLQDIIRYFVRFYPRRVSRTILVKLVYLADVEFFRRYARKMTGLEYQHHHFGPFSWGVIDTADELVAKKLIRTISTTNIYGDPTIVYKSTTEERLGFDSLDSYCFDVVRFVNNKFSTLSFTQLLDYVYSTPPMVNVPSGEVINFDTLRNPVQDALAEHTRANISYKGEELIQNLRKRLGDQVKGDYEFDEDEKKELLENAELSTSASAEYVEEV